jgi:hypothetical protein
MYEVGAFLRPRDRGMEAGSIALRPTFVNHVHATVRVQDAVPAMQPHLLSVALPLLLVAALVPTRATSGSCSAFQAAVPRNSYRVAANSDTCDDDACAVVMRDASQALPDCLVDGGSLRANVTTSIARCASADRSEASVRARTRSPCGPSRSPGDGHCAAGQLHPGRRPLFLPQGWSNRWRRGDEKRRTLPHFP